MKNGSVSVLSRHVQLRFVSMLRWRIGVDFAVKQSHSLNSWVQQVYPSCLPKCTVVDVSLFGWGLRVDFETEFNSIKLLHKADYSML